MTLPITMSCVLLTMASMLSAGEPSIAVRGRLLYELPKDELPKGWGGLGKQSLVEDAWVITEDPKDKHAASAKRILKKTDVVVEWEWKLHTAQSATFRFDIKGAHLCHVTWRPSQGSRPGTISLELYDYDRKAGPEEARVLQKRNVSVQSDEWVKSRWEMLDGKARITFGNVVLYAEDKAFALEKFAMGLRVVKGSAHVRGLKVYEAEQRRDTPSVL